MTRSIALLAAALLFQPLSAVPLEVKDTQGRSLKIELEQFASDQVTFVIEGKKQKYKLPLDRFDPASQKEITQASLTLPLPLPELDFDNVTVSKRTKDDGDSYYMEQQEILGSISIKNRSATENYSPCTITLVVIGQDQRRTDLYKVITQQTFETQPPPLKSLKHEIDPVFTKYDSDNKGRGNIGGFAFAGYIITVKTTDDRLVLQKVIGGMPRSSINADPGILDRLSEYKTGTLMTKTMSTNKKEISKIGVTRY